MCDYILNKLGMLIAKECEHQFNLDLRCIYCKLRKEHINKLLEELKKIKCE